MRKLRQGTARCRQIDVEGVVRLPGDLKPWGCHANQYGIVRPELYSAWLVLDRQHPHMPYIAVDSQHSDRASGCHAGGFLQNLKESMITPKFLHEGAAFVE
jgi:hypothetical protein